PGSFPAMEEYKGKPVEVKDGKFRIKVPARSFRIVAFPPRSEYPRKDPMTKIWSNWHGKNCDSSFELSRDGGINGSSCLLLTCRRTGGGVFLAHGKVRQGFRYVCKIKARQKNGKKMVLAVQARNGGKFVGLPPVSAGKPSSEEWQELVLSFDVPSQGKWKDCDNVLITLGGGGPDSVTWFDDFEMEEIPLNAEKGKGAEKK
ncbi:MAG: hypothetical protein J6A21_08590, partial [Lentisphaeria bacterium]|nr:hypothetical protein [Lentisphaeria bacterium]